MARARAPFPWYGGKQYLVPRLVGHLPEHRVYVEVFGGAASLLFAKEPSELEIYNDLDSNLVRFFRILRDSEQSAELCRQLDLTPYSREEWRRSVEQMHSGEGSEIEQARRWYTALVQSFSKTSAKPHGWSYSKDGRDAHCPRQFRSRVQALLAFAERFRLVQVEHLDALDCIAKYDSPDTLFYVDPPYIAETRVAKAQYLHEMSDADHERLLQVLRAVKGKVLVSGYAHRIYDVHLAEWVEESSAAVAWGGNAGKSKGRTTRSERIWRNYNYEQTSLFGEQAG